MIYLDFNILKDKKSREKFLASNCPVPVVLLSDSKIDIIDGYRYLSSYLIIDVIGNSSIDIENHLKHRLIEENHRYYNFVSGELKLVCWDNYKEFMGTDALSPYDMLGFKIYSDCDMPDWMKGHRKKL